MTNKMVPDVRFYRNALSSLLRGICSTTYFPTDWDDMEYVQQAKRALAAAPEPPSVESRPAPVGVVDEGMVERACEAYWIHWNLRGYYNTGSKAAKRKLMSPALQAAALTPAAPVAESVAVPNPAFVGEWHRRAVELGYDGVSELIAFALPCRVNSGGDERAPPVAAGLTVEESLKAAYRLLETPTTTGCHTPGQSTRQNLQHLLPPSASPSPPTANSAPPRKSRRRSMRGRGWSI